MNDEFYMDQDNVNNKKWKGNGNKNNYYNSYNNNKISKVKTILIIQVSIILILLVAIAILLLNKGNKVQKHYNKVDQIETELKENMTSLALIYEDEETMIELYDNYEYIKKSNDNESGNKFQIEKGMFNQEAYDELYNIMTKYANEGIEFSSDLDNLELELPSKIFFLVKNNMYLYDYISEEDIKFSTIENIISNQNNYTVDVKKEVK